MAPAARSSANERVTSVTSGAHALGERELCIERLLKVDRRHAVVVLQQKVVEVEHLAELGGKAVALEEVGDPHGAPRHLVLVGRADAAAGGADRVGAAGTLARLIEQHVGGQDERALRRDSQPLRHRHALLHQHVALGEQRLEREHHAVADETAHLRAQDPGGNERQHGLPAADHQGVAGVVPALEARHRGGALGEQVDDLALAFIAPLGADDDDESAHACLPRHEQDDHADQHAAEARDAQLAVAQLGEPCERTLHALGMQERGDAFEHEKQAERGRQVR